MKKSMQLFHKKTWCSSAAARPALGQKKYIILWQKEFFRLKLSLLLVKLL
ncbi:Uncharacterised protein [uncultured Bacteroides sp.]|nr:Uncharacterised protein [uncultured Bacteroides sp.]